MEYNGWTNYETWLVHLWLTNDEDVYVYWLEKAARSQSVYHLATLLKQSAYNEAYKALPVHQSGMIHDLLVGAIQSVNFDEIAKALTEVNETA